MDSTRHVATNCAKSGSGTKPRQKSGSPSLESELKLSRRPSPEAQPAPRVHSKLCFIISCQFWFCKSLVAFFDKKEFPNHSETMRNRFRGQFCIDIVGAFFSERPSDRKVVAHWSHEGGRWLCIIAFFGVEWFLISGNLYCTYQELNQNLARIAILPHHNLSRFFGGRCIEVGWKCNTICVWGRSPSSWVMKLLWPAFCGRDPLQRWEDGENQGQGRGYR